MYVTTEEILDKCETLLRRIEDGRDLIHDCVTKEVTELCTQAMNDAEDLVKKISQVVVM